MSDDFIPINHSTPVRGSPCWHQGRNQNQKKYYNNHYQNGNGQRRGGGYNNKRGNVSRNSSFESESNGSYGQDNKNNIDAYLHPSMLQDPWANLRQRNK